MTRFLVVAGADELLTAPDLLREYLAAFGEADDATLIIGAEDVPEAAARLGPLVPDGGADLLLVPADGLPRPAGARAALTTGTAEGLLCFGPGEAPALRALYESGPRRGVLIVVENFLPSVGGVERIAEGLGLYLAGRGFDVGVVAYPHPGREGRDHRGLTVHELPRTDEIAALDRIVAETGVEAVIGLEAYPTAIPTLATLLLQRSGVRRIVKPCVNEDAYRIAVERPGFLGPYAQLLAGADGFAVSSLAGWDARLAAELGVHASYIPNAGAEAEPTAAFRAERGIEPDVPLLLVVANLWPEKNHLGLLEAMRTEPGDWRLVLVGGDAPVHPELAGRIREEAARDPRVVLAGPAGPGEVAAAMEAADLLLLPSKAEATPLVLVEAMSRRLPWLATPTCGSAPDLSGGLIVPVERFPGAVTRLLADREERAALAAAGREHWQACYTWDEVGARYLALIDGADPGGPSPAPAAAAAVTRAARARHEPGRLAA